MNAASSSPTHYCWPGCGCMQQAWRLDRGLSPFEHEQTLQPIPSYLDVQPFPAEQPLPPIQNIVCPCNMTWCGIGPPPRCFIHNPPYQQVWVGITQPNWEAIKGILELNKNFEYGHMARFIGPSIIGDLLRQLL